MFSRVLCSLAMLFLLGGCASSRILRLENDLLQRRNSELQETVDDLTNRLPGKASFSRRVTLARLTEFLEQGQYSHKLSESNGGGKHIRLEFTGNNTSFSLTIQHFDSSDIVFITTSSLFYLDEAQNVESVVSLLTHLALANYEMLVGKFQLNPKSGEIMLSTELHVENGLAQKTFLHAIDSISQTADEQYLQLLDAARGLGI